MASSAKKWSTSKKAWNENREKNLQKASDTYTDNSLVQALQDAINAKYNKNDYGKYYFRDDDYNKEFNDIVNNFTNKQKGNLQNVLTNASVNYDPTYGGGFNTNYADQYVDNFLNSQYNDALEQLDRAKSRGTINDVGYNRAINDLATQLSANKSTYGSIGRDIISGYNTGMQTNINNYQNLLDNYNLGTDYSKLNADIINNNLNTAYNNYLSGFENDFDAAMSGQTPFDVSGILGNAKVAQGVVNPQSNSLVDALSEQNSKKNKKVGLGNEGVF